MSKISMGYVILYVADVKQTVEFWERAFGLATKFVHESGQYAEMDTGTTTLSFASDAQVASQHLRYRENRRGDLPAGFEVALTTVEVDTLFARADREGAIVVKPIEQKPWGQRCGYVRDCNGILVEICTPMGG